MPFAAVAGHYEILNALRDKTEQNSEITSTVIVRNVNCCKNEQGKHLERTNFTT